jgi:hypothetical protein
MSSGFVSDVLCFLIFFPICACHVGDVFHALETSMGRIVRVRDTNMKCIYCQDTGAVDKNGNIKGEHKGVLQACPACKKDGVKTELNVNVDAVVESLIHKDKAWVVDFSPTIFKSYEETSYRVRELASYVKKLYTARDPDTKNPRPDVQACVYMGKTSEGWIRLGFHSTFGYSNIQDVIAKLGLPKEEYKITLKTKESSVKK